MLPLLNHLLKVLRKFRIKSKKFLGDGVNKAQRFRVEGLSGYNLKTILHKLLVFSENGSFHNLVATVHGIIKDRMANVFQVSSDLVSAARFQFAFQQGNIANGL